MADFNPHVASGADQSQAYSRSVAVPADSYTLLLVVAVLVLVISLAGLAFFLVRYYGGLAPKPVIGQVTAVSERGIRIDIGSQKGLTKGQTLLALRRGAFLADLSVQAVEPDGATASTVNNQTGIIARGDTVIFSPLDRQ